MTDQPPEVVPLAPAPTRSKAVAVLHFLLGSIPSLVVLAAIATVGWYGSTHDWKLPKFSELTEDPPEKDDWCAEHRVPESACIECNEKLFPRPKERGTCEPHALAECVLCDPKLAQLPTVPTISAADLARAAGSLAGRDTDTNAKGCKKHLRRFQFVSESDVKKAGIECDTAQVRPVTEEVPAAGELGYDQTKVAHLSVRSAGSVSRVFKRQGQTVKAGDVLTVIESADVGKAKVDIMQAFGTLQLRQQALAVLRASSVTAEARIREAEGQVREAELRLAGACQSLTNLGLPFAPSDATGQTEEQLREKLLFRGLPAEVAADFDRKTATANLLPLFAPMNGLITSRDVVPGEVVDPAKVLFELVDTSTLWLTLDVKGEDADKATVGRPVRFAPDHERAQVKATINWRSSQVDPKTRTLKVRAEVPNPDGKLLASTYGTGFVVTREVPAALKVKAAAVQWEGCCHVVFVRDKSANGSGKDGTVVFHTRKVRVGAGPDERGLIEVVGVLEGEAVVIEGAGALAAELRKDDLGDGCCGGHGKKEKDKD